MPCAEWHFKRKEKNSSLMFVHLDFWNGIKAIHKRSHEKINFKLKISTTWAPWKLLCGLVLWMLQRDVSFGKSCGSEKYSDVGERERRKQSLRMINFKLIILVDFYIIQLYFVSKILNTDKIHSQRLDAPFEHRISFSSWI